MDQTNTSIRHFFDIYRKKKSTGEMESLIRPDQLSCAQMMALDTVARAVDDETFARIAKETATITEPERLTFFSLSEFLENPTWGRAPHGVNRERNNLFNNLPELRTNAGTLVLKETERANAKKVERYAAALRQWAFTSEIVTLREQLSRFVNNRRRFLSSPVLCTTLRGVHVFFDMPLSEAYHHDSTNIVKLLVSRGASWCPNKEKDTALHVATRDGKLRMAKIFFKKNKTHLYKKNKKGETPLGIALRREDQKLLKIFSGEK